MVRLEHPEARLAEGGGVPVCRCGHVNEAMDQRYRDVGVAADLLDEINEIALLLRGIDPRG